MYAAADNSLPPSTPLPSPPLRSPPDLPPAVRAAHASVCRHSLKVKGLTAVGARAIIVYTSAKYKVQHGRPRCKPMLACLWPAACCVLHAR